MELSDLGIKVGGLYEAIVTTFHKDGSPNAAPMGIFGMGVDEVIIRAHTDTDTYENIMRRRCCVINIVFDPLLFLNCALVGKHKGSSEVETATIDQADGVSAPYLAGAQAYVEAELKEVKEIEKKDRHGAAIFARMVLKAVEIKVITPYPIAPTRGFFATIELAIALSRGLDKDIMRYMTVIRKTLRPEDSREVEEFVENYLNTKP